jgi:hypothetical protein
VRAKTEKKEMKRKADRKKKGKTNSLAFLTFFNNTVPAAFFNYSELGFHGYL